MYYIEKVFLSKVLKIWNALSSVITQLVVSEVTVFCNDFCCTRNAQTTALNDYFYSN